MTTPEKPRWRAAHVERGLSLLLGLTLAACSGPQGNSAGDDAASDVGETSNSSDETTDGGQDTTDGGEDSTGTDGDTEPSSEDSHDPGLELDACDPKASQVVSFDLSEANDEVAPALIRQAVLAGDGMIPRIPLSPRPFLNHFRFDYPAVQGSAPEVFGELWKPQMMANVNDSLAHYRLQFAVRSPAVDPNQRPPVDLAVVVDLGPTMSGMPLELAEEALAAIESALRPGDRVSLIAAGQEPTVITEGALITDPNMTPLTGMLMLEDAPGYADVPAALELGYALTEEPWEGQGQRRVLLISNGHFMAPPALVTAVAEHADDGHYLLELAVGEATRFADPTLRALAHAGRGSRLYADDPEALWSELGEGFAGNLIATLGDVEVTLELPPGLAISSDDASWGGVVTEAGLAMAGADDTLVFHHDLEACGELDPLAVIRVEVEWTDPLAQEAGVVVWEQPVAELGFGAATTRKGAAVVAYTEALIAYRNAAGVPTEGYGAVLEAISMIAEALQVSPNDADLIEMSEILAKLEG